MKIEITESRRKAKDPQGNYYLVKIDDKQQIMERSEVRHMIEILDNGIGI